MLSANKDSFFFPPNLYMFVILFCLLHYPRPGGGTTPRQCTMVLFRGMLFNIYEFGGFLVMFLSLISILTPL